VAYVDPSTNRVKAAAASIERLEALNPQIWAYFASLEFEGNQVGRVGGRKGQREREGASER